MSTFNINIGGGNVGGLQVGDNNSQTITQNNGPTEPTPEAVFDAIAAELPEPSPEVVQSIEASEAREARGRAANAGRNADRSTARADHAREGHAAANEPGAIRAANRERCRYVWRGRPRGIGPCEIRSSPAPWHCVRQTRPKYERQGKALSLP